MKQSLLLFTLIAIFTLPTAGFASAMIICSIEAKVDKIDGNTITVTVKKSEYENGHSAGKDCQILVGQSAKIEIKKPSGQIKIGDIVKLSHETVYNFRPKKDGTYEHLVFRSWTFLGKL